MNVFILSSTTSHIERHSTIIQKQGYNKVKKVKRLHIIDGNYIKNYYSR